MAEKQKFRGIIFSDIYSDLDDPATFWDLPEGQRQALLRWIVSSLIHTRAEEFSSYGLKHVFERSPGGFYITDVEYKGAMQEAEHKTVSDDSA